MQHAGLQLCIYELLYLVNFCSTLPGKCWISYLDVEWISCLFMSVFLEPVFRIFSNIRCSCNCKVISSISSSSIINTFSQCFGSVSFLSWSSYPFSRNRSGTYPKYKKYKLFSTLFLFWLHKNYCFVSLWTYNFIMLLNNLFIFNYGNLSHQQDNQTSSATISAPSLNAVEETTHPFFLLHWACDQC